MCKAVKGAGATCVIASVTPKSKWSGTSLFYNSPYTSQAKAAASAAGGIYVPHLETIGKQVAAQGFPVAQQYWLGNGALQPNTAGADAFASAFAGEFKTWLLDHFRTAILIVVVLQLLSGAQVSAPSHQVLQKPERLSQDCARQWKISNTYTQRICER